MPPLPARILSPEDEELARKQSQLAGLEIRLADQELALATLRAELTAFEHRYLKLVGRRYVELDLLEALIAEAQYRRNPTDAAAQQQAETARARATESEQSIGSLIPASQEQPTYSETLRELYREAAKLLHPDLTTDPSQRDIRKQRMAEVNAAYEKGDEAGLREIIRNWHASPETVEGSGTAADLVRAIRKIAQVETRLHGIALEFERIRGGDLFNLSQKAAEAAEEGRDLLAEMAARVDLQIADAQRRLNEIA
jgi:hypothetical protein